MKQKNEYENQNGFFLTEAQQRDGDKTKVKKRKQSQPVYHAT